MPSYDGFRLDDGQRCAPVAPQAGETDPQEAVAGGQFRTFCGGSLKHTDLVAQGQVFELQRGTRTQNRRQDGKERRKKNKHQREIMKEDKPHSLKHFEIYETRNRSCRASSTDSMRTQFLVATVT